MDDAVGLAIDLRDPDGDGRLRLADFRTHPGDKANVSIDGSPNVDDAVLELSVNASSLVSGGDSTLLKGARVKLTWADVSAPGDVRLTAEGQYHTLTDFLKVDTGKVLEQIEKLTEIGKALEAGVPLIAKNLDDLVGFVNLVGNKIIDPLTAELGSANFLSAQDLAIRLAEYLCIDPAQFGLSFDPNNGELTYHLIIDKSFHTDDTLKLGFDLPRAWPASISTPTPASTPILAWI